MDYKKLIEKRQSYRNFTNKNIEKKSIKEIKDFFDSSIKFNENEISIEIFTEVKNNFEDSIGYCGYSLDAPTYIVILGEKKDNSYINAGFRAMNLTLKLVDMGIDSCFLTVNDSNKVKEILKINNNLEILTIIACGYAEEIKDFVRLDIKSPSDVSFTSRKGYFAPKITLSEMVYNGEWGNKLEITDHFPGEILENSLYAAALAPYLFNKQNYKYILVGKKLILCNKKDGTISKKDADIGMGATMFNFFITYSRFNKEIDMWNLNKNDINIDIPSNYEFIAYLNV